MVRSPYRFGVAGFGVARLGLPDWGCQVWSYRIRAIYGAIALPPHRVSLLFC